MTHQVRLTGYLSWHILVINLTGTLQLNTGISRGIVRCICIDEKGEPRETTIVLHHFSVWGFFDPDADPCLLAGGPSAGFRLAEQWGGELGSDQPVYVLCTHAAHRHLAE